MENKPFWWIAGKRAYELKEEGKTSAEQADIINQEHPDRQCAPATIRGYMCKYVKVMEAEKNEPKLSVVPDTEPKKAPVKPEPVHPGIPAPDLEKHMRAIAEEVFREMMESSQGSIDRSDMPPPPVPVDPHLPGRGKENREYHKFSATIDKNLWALLYTDMLKHGLSTGRMLDVILWRYYERPPLSYEAYAESHAEQSNQCIEQKDE